MQLGSITPFVQPLDMAFNHKLKKEIKKAHSFAPNDERLGKYFITRTGKAKPGIFIPLHFVLRRLLLNLSIFRTFSSTR